MKPYIDQFIEQGTFQGLPADLVYAAFIVLVAIAVLSVFVAPLAGVTSWLERRVWGRIQSRVGPNRVGPQGILQWLADGIKNLLKEDIIPAAADKRLFTLAPYIVFVGFLATFVVIQLGIEFCPKGPAIGKVARKFKPPAGETYVRVEAPRGDMGFYVVSDGSEYPYRVRIRTGSFTAMSIVDKLSRGLMLADLIALIASLDVDAPEIDR